MNKIKFSHRYAKLSKINNAEPVTLVQVESICIGRLTDDFLKYDTLYFEGGKPKHYDISNLKMVLLLHFVDCNGMLFTTIRRETPSKKKYYLDNEGKDFELVINSSNRSKDIKQQVRRNKYE